MSSFDFELADSIRQLHVNRLNRPTFARYEAITFTRLELNDFWLPLLYSLTANNIHLLYCQIDMANPTPSKINSFIQPAQPRRSTALPVDRPVSVKCLCIRKYISCYFVQYYLRTNPRNS